jgi:CheY-like chemotaxis protein
MLEFEIKDTGIGIKKEDVERLFNDFFQADIQKNRGIIGTGLGLTISKGFAQLMGGDILLDSEYGQWTAFTLRIPLVDGNEEDAAIEQDDSQIEDLVVTGAKILVVDDNEFNLKVARGLLELNGIEPETALSGEEAITLVRNNDYDLVLMDHMMPEMDGIEATAAIRALRGKYEKLPIIACTANAIQGAREMYLEHGFNGFISKPVSVGKINEILKTWLPPEKVGIRMESAEEVPKQETGILNILDGIDGIDKEIGLNHFGGEEEMYYETLKSFVKYFNMQCEKMTAVLESQDISGFAASAHLVKSMLSTIGAMGLYESALALEMAAKAGEAEFCQGKYPESLEKIMKLYSSLADALESAENVLQSNL